MENKKLAALVVTSIFTALLTNEVNPQLALNDANIHEVATLDVEMRTCGQCNQPRPSLQT